MTATSAPAPALTRDQIECWREMPGYPGVYEVSDRGRVRLLRYRKGKRDVIRPEPLILRQRIGKTGYPVVGLWRDGVVATWSVHRLVLTVFVGPCPPGLEGAHLNGNRVDNRLVNLRWVTRKENQSHRWLHGTMLCGDRATSRTHIARRPRGEAHYHAMLTEAAVRSIRARAAAGDKKSEIARDVGVGVARVRAIVRGDGWRHVR